MKKFFLWILAIVHIVGVMAIATGCSSDNNQTAEPDYIIYAVKGKVSFTHIIDPETGLSVDFDGSKISWDETGPISDYVKAISEIAPSNNTVEKDVEIRVTCDAIYESHVEMMDALGFLGNVEIVKVTDGSETVIWSQTYPN